MAERLAADIDLSFDDALRQVDQLASKMEQQLGGAAKAVSSSGAGQLGAGLAQLGPEADKAAAGLYRYQEEVARTREQERLANQQRRETEQSLQRVGNAAGVAGAAIAAGLGIAVVASMNFDKQMSMLGAVSDASASQLDRLRDSALEAGAATVFSASDAARAQTELAKAGVSTADILGGALTGALNLASAGQLDLGRAAEIAAQAMTTFEKSGDDVAHIADVLAAGANKSTASVESLAQGLENVGGVAAKLFNLSMEETVGTLALFDQNAIRGAEGGTALRSALLSLATPSTVQASLLNEIAYQTGVTITEFDSLAGLAGNLQRAFSGMDAEQRRFAMGVLFGTYGIRAANVLYAEGEAGVRKWTAAVNDSGAAQRFASIAMDNLAGDVEEFRGAVETGLIGAGSTANGILRDMTQVATDAVRGVSELPSPLQAAGFALAALTSAGLGAVFVFGSLLPKWHALQASLKTMGPIGSFAAQNMRAITTAAAGAAVAVVSFQMIGKSAESTAIGIGGMTAAGAMLGSVIPGVGTAIGAAAGFTIGLGKAAFSAASDMEVFDKRIEDVASSLEKLGAKRSAASFLDQLRGSFFDFSANVDVIRRQLRVLATESPAAAQNVIAGLAAMRNEAGKPMFNEAQMAAFEKALGRGEAGYAKLAERARDADEKNRAVASGAQETAAALDLQAGSAEEAVKSWEQYIKALTSGLPTVNGLFGEAANAVEDWSRASSPEELLANLRAQVEGVASFAENIKHLASVGLTDLAAHLAQMGPQAGGQIAQALRDASPEMQQEIENMLDAGETEITNFASWLNGPGASMLRTSAFAMGLGVGEGVGLGITGSTPGATSAATALVTGASTALNPLPPAGSAAGSLMAAAVGTGILEGKPRATGASDELVGAVRDALGFGVGDAETKGADTGEGFARGVESKRGRAASAAATVADAARAAMSAVLNFGSPSKVTYEFGEWTSEGFALGIQAGTPTAVRAAESMAAQVEARMEASAARIAANNRLGINVGNLPVPEGYVSAPVGVRSSALWTQEMVDAYEAARPLAERIDLAQMELDAATQNLADVVAYTEGILNAVRAQGDPAELARAERDVAAARQEADDFVSQLKTRLVSLRDTGALPASAAPAVQPAATESDDFKAAQAYRDLMEAIDRNTAGVADMVTRQGELVALLAPVRFPLPVDVVRMPGPSVQVGEIRVDVRVEGGASAVDAARLRDAARAGAEAALQAEWGAGLSLRTVTATIGAL